MNIYKKIIKAITESYSASDFGAWFVSIREGRSIDVSEDRGGGHHAGYLWATKDVKNAKRIGLAESDMKLVRDYFLSEEDNWIEREDNFIGGSMVMRPNNKEFLLAIAPIYNNYFRAIYNDDFGGMLFTIGKPDKETHHMVIAFLIEVSRSKEIDVIYVDTYDDKSIWTGLTLQEAAGTDSFSDIIEDKWKGYSNYYYKDTR